MRAKGTTGGLYQTLIETTVTLSGATTTATLNIPGDSQITATQFKVEEEITSADGGTAWAAAYSGGSTLSICTAQSFLVDTKYNSFVTGNTAGVTNITITCNGGKTFAGGVIRIISYVKTLLEM